MFRNILAIITGYTLFVVSSLILFKVAGVDPHGRASINFQMLTVIYGAIFSFLSGLVVQLIAKIKQIVLNYILALVIAGFAILSLLKTDGAYWSQLLAIIIFAPVSFWGGLFYVARHTK
jgi:hypothetical protein